MNVALLDTAAFVCCENPRCRLDYDHEGDCDERLGWELGELAAAEAWDRMAAQARARHLTMLPPPRSVYDTMPCPPPEAAYAYREQIARTLLAAGYSTVAIVDCETDDVFEATSMGAAS